MRTMAYRRRKFFIAPIILLALAVFSALTMALWNALMPIIFHLPMIGYWQAAGLLILARILFGGGRPHHRGWHGGHWYGGFREKLANMSPEQREKLFQKMHHYRKSWHHDFCEEEKSQPGSDDKKNED